MKRTQHERYMDLALAQAGRAFALNEVPVGALIVDGDGKVIARAHNVVERKKTQTAHAELLVLAKAGKKIGDWRLENCWLYVTLQPCSMCWNAILLSRLQGVVYGATSTLFGYHLDKHTDSLLYKDRSMPLSVVTGVRAEESKALLQRFFKQKRVGHDE